jgi:hypothetical protein
MGTTMEEMPEAIGYKRMRSLGLGRAALENVMETGCDPAADIAALRHGRHTEESLLSHCLDGADEDREDGWREYVQAIAVAARRCTCSTWHMPDPGCHWHGVGAS